MKNNKITFDIKDDKITLSYKNPMALPDFLTVISTGILSCLKSIVNSVPEEQRQAVVEELYDMYNAAASNTLHYFAPEIDMRPDLTAQAILEAENKIIDREYQRTKKEPGYVSPLAQAPTGHDPVLTELNKPNEAAKADKPKLSVVKPNIN